MPSILACGEIEIATPCRWLAGGRVASPASLNYGSLRPAPLTGRRDRFAKGPPVHPSHAAAALASPPVALFFTNAKKFRQP